MLIPKITDYQILTHSQNRYLERVVADYIKEGWQPLGGVSVCLHATSNRYESTKEYFQAIVKYEQQKPNSI